MDSDQETVPDNPATGRFAALNATRGVVEAQLEQAPQETRTAMAHADVNAARAALRKAERKLGRVTEIRGQMSCLLHGADCTTNARAIEEARDQVGELRDDYENWL